MSESGLSAELLKKIQNDGFDPIYDKCPECPDYADEEYELYDEDTERYVEYYACPNGHVWTK